MPKIEHWDNLPEGVRQHLIDRMRDRAISKSNALTSLQFTGTTYPISSTLQGKSNKINVELYTRGSICSSRTQIHVPSARWHDAPILRNSSAFENGQTIWALKGLTILNRA